MSKPHIYFEIGPLKESEYTGIAQVTAALAENFLEDSSVASSFFFGRMLVTESVVRDLLRRRDGGLLEWYLQRAVPRPAPRNVSQSNIAIFPNRKTCRYGFDKECQIIHDLSTLLTPQFHHPDTIEYHATTMEGDILSNDVTFCVSEATRSDVLSYFPAVRADRVRTLLLSASNPKVSSAQELEVPMERYILVLGTIEPRKNIGQVLQYLRDKPEFSKRYRIVFLGRFGWGAPIADLMGQFNLNEQYDAGRILFPGFVTENVKNLLIRNAKLLVYPSLFEGFGLPLVEAAALGVPSITTRSSSLPEAGGPYSYYFDPFTMGDFERTLMRAVLDQEVRGSIIRERCYAWSSNFSWQRTYAELKDAVMALFPVKET